jgi:hypothetical protein
MSTPAPASAISRFIGRAAAHCVHPYASWRKLSASGRAGLVAAYVGAGYVAVLSLLLIVR